MAPKYVVLLRTDERGFIGTSPDTKIHVFSDLCVDSAKLQKRQARHYSDSRRPRMPRKQIRMLHVLELPRKGAYCNEYNDSKYCPELDIGAIRKLHEEDIAWLKYLDLTDTVVVTHHLPSYSMRSPIYDNERGRRVASYFYDLVAPLIRATCL